MIDTIIPHVGGRALSQSMWPGLTPIIKPSIKKIIYSYKQVAELYKCATHYTVLASTCVLHCCHWCIQFTILVWCDEKRILESRTITTTDISKKLSTSIEHTHCITITLSHIKNVITVHIHTMWFFLTDCLLPFCLWQPTPHPRGWTFELGCCHDQLRRPFHRIYGYSMWIVELSQMRSFTTKTVRISEVRIKDLNTMVIFISNEKFSIMMNSHTIRVVSSNVSNTDSNRILTQQHGTHIYIVSNVLYN